MQPLTHILFGAALGRAGFNRRTAYATPLMALAAELPDVDVISEVRGQAFAFQHHRGFTHSFLGVPLDAAAALIIIYGAHLWRLQWRRNRAKPQPARVPRWGWLFALGCLAALSHILLDFTNAYGVRPLMPFSYRWYHWDIVSIFEPTLDLLLLAGLILPSLFGLIQEEISARGKRQPLRGRGTAIAALLGVLLVWGARDYEHRRAIAALSALDYGGEIPQRVSAFPNVFSIFDWQGVVETAPALYSMQVNSLGPEVDPDRRMRVFYKHAPTPPLEAAMRSQLGRVFMDWADYPRYEIERLTTRVAPGSGAVTEELPEAPAGEPATGAAPSGYLVRMIDLRYDYSGRGRSPLSATVELDSKLNVTASYFGLGARPGSARSGE